MAAIHFLKKISRQWWPLTNQFSLQTQKIPPKTKTLEFKGKSWKRLDDHEIFCFEIVEYIGLPLIWSKIKEKAAFCNRILLIPLYLSSTQNLCWTESFGYCYHFYVDPNCGGHCNLFPISGFYETKHII